MIKVKRDYELSTGEYYLSTKVICRTNRATKWFFINHHHTSDWHWASPRSYFRAYLSKCME